MSQQPDHIALVVSRFNERITKALLEEAVAELAKANYAIADDDIFWVPGAVELPLVAQKIAQSKRYQAIICLGAVIRGETAHFDYVCQQVSHGCQRVALDHGLPVIFGVLTTEDVAQAEQRIGGSHGHKGREAALAAVEMLTLMRRFND